MPSPLPRLVRCVAERGGPAAVRSIARALREIPLATLKAAVRENYRSTSANTAESTANTVRVCSKRAKKRDRLVDVYAKSIHPHLKKITRPENGHRWSVSPRWAAGVPGEPRDHDTFEPVYGRCCHPL
eukprot:241582-Prorocentrum_minimum.AAC.2